MWNLVGGKSPYKWHKSCQVPGAGFWGGGSLAITGTESVLASVWCGAMSASEHCVPVAPDMPEETSTRPPAPCVQNVVLALAQPFPFPTSLASFH